MTNEMYKLTLDALMGQVSVLCELELSEARKDLSMVESIGPLIDPTAFLGNVNGAFQRIQDQKDILDAAIRLQIVARNIKERLSV